MPRRVTYITVLLCLAGAGGIALAGIRPNPANDPRLVDRPIEDSRYDGAERCNGGRVPPGMKAFEAWLDRHVAGETIGVYRCEKWDRRSASLHSVGRAIDWHLDARRGTERRAAERLISLLLETDRNGNEAALARRMGVQGLIFNCRSWWGWSNELGRYDYCYRRDGDGERKPNLDPTQAHIDHLHLELTRPGSKRQTSFWRSPLAAE